MSVTKVGAQERFEFRHQQMGTQIRLVLYADESQKAYSASVLAFQKIDRLNAILSDYIADSELSRLDKKPQEDILVSGDLYRILRTAVEISEQTQGAFDITVGPLVKIWRNSRKMGTLPPERELADAKRATGYSLVTFPKKNTVRLARAGMKLDLGGIGKGYAADEVLKLLDSMGIRSALIDMGGDISVTDPPPRMDYWTLGFSYFDAEGKEIFQKVRLRNQAMATSGDLYQYVEINGRRYSHIVDPRTGMALDNGIQATVIAPNATLADAYASAVSVLGIEKTKIKEKELQNIEMFLLERSVDRYQQWNSEGFEPLLLQD